MSPIRQLDDFGGPDGPRLIFSVTLDGYRYEFCPDRALVYKGDATEPSYRITAAGCDCPSAAYGKRPCKHEKPITFRSDSTDEEEAGGVVITTHAPGMSAEEADDILADLLG